MRNSHGVLMTSYEPIVEGHCMVLPLRHVKSWSALKPIEAKAVWELIEEACALLSRVYALDCIVHVNKGAHATQSHVHAHIIPIEKRLRFRELFAKELKKPPRERASEEALKAVQSRIQRHARQPKA